MEQVVVNLVVNAEHALAHTTGDRRLTIRTRATHRGMALHVEDTGPGIPPGLLDRVFDPFFTTKAPGEGTGLGLSLVHNIITEHGGVVQVESEAGRGTTFRVDLPRARSETSATSTSAGASRTQPLHILVVDDEPAIRRALSRYLSRRGHDVHVAGDGGEALTLIETTLPDRPYDVILSDLRMPGLGGEQLLEKLKEQGADMDRRVIFLTGDAASGDAARFLAASNAPVIYKPVELADLASRIERHAADLSNTST
jgi:CheY-like chemotaxis protein/anti-sigma regulatory factor (Ser/Thr protein kinase)